jgi:hypothetical protein
MRVEIDIGDEMLDEAFRKNLEWHLKYTKRDLTVLRGKKNLQRHESEDKEYFEKLYPALKIVGEYYGVKHK